MTPASDSPVFGVAGAVRLALLAKYQQGLRKPDAFAAYVSQLIGLLREGKRVRMLPSRELVRQAAELLQRESEQSLLHKPFESKDARAQRELALSTLKQFHDFLTYEYAAACPESFSLTEWPNGAEVYQELVRRYTTSRSDPKQIHQFGLREVARIREAMAAVIVRIGYKGRLDDFLAAARTDQRFYFRNEGELLTAYRGAAARIEPLVPKVVHRLPRTSVRVEPVRSGGAAATYQPPRNGSKDGFVAVDVAKLELRPRFEIISLMLHEGMPGHYLQFALTRDSRTDGSDEIAEFKLLRPQSTAFCGGLGGVRRNSSITVL